MARDVELREKEPEVSLDFDTGKKAESLQTTDSNGWRFDG